MTNFKLKAISIFPLMVLLSISTSLSAELFYRTGTISRTLSHVSQFGGCMIHISSPIGNGCPDNGWVSLDCEGKYNNENFGKRTYATALVAFSLDKQVSLRIDNAKKVDGFCTAIRLDML